jgi:hypothetical protein
MASNKPRDVAASVRQRLLNYSTAKKADPNLVLICSSLRVAEIRDGQEYGADVIKAVGEFILPPVRAAHQSRAFPQRWTPESAWH